MKKGLLAIGLATSLFGTNAFADDTGNELLRECTEVVNFMDNPSQQGNTKSSQLISGTNCMSYTSGVRDTLVVSEIACIPAEVERGQIARIVTKYGREHPDVLDSPRIVLAATPLIRMYPCPSK